jgi:alpha-L-arabinofuranosidase
MDETPADMADFIEYAKGASNTPMGRQRVEDGHPAPYSLPYIELGNEEAVNETYWQKFKALAEVIWAKDDKIILVLGDFAYGKVIDDPFNFPGGAAVKSLAAQKKILDFAREHNREVWFDIHVWTENPPHPNGMRPEQSYIEHLAKLSPGAKFKVVVFEFNANNHSMKRALANALGVNQVERLGAYIPILCSANCLQPYRQNDNGWDQGLLFLSPSQVWPQPPYFVTQMVSRNYLSNLVKSETQSPNDILDATAKKSDDGKVLTLQVVNPGKAPLATAIHLEAFVSAKATARVTTLSGDWEDRNTPEQPDRVKPVESNWTHAFQNGKASYTFPANSFTTIRLE